MGFPWPVDMRVEAIEYGFDRRGTPERSGREWVSEGRIADGDFDGTRTTLCLPRERRIARSLIGIY